jgi:hypothetical protein
MIIKLSATTGEVLEVKDSPGVLCKQLADELAWRTKKIWEVEAEKVSKAITQTKEDSDAGMEQSH